MLIYLKMLVILARFFSRFHFAQVTFNRTFTPSSRCFWPKLPHQLRYPQHTRRLAYFFFFEGPKGRYGPREAWAHMGWVGHPAHYRSRFIFLFLLSHVHSPSARYRLQCTTQRVVHMCTPKGCTLYNACARVREAHVAILAKIVAV